jgi:hypothetical protein
MNTKKIEREVKKNSREAAKLIKKYIKTQRNKYLVYYQGKHFIEKDLTSSLIRAFSEFGKNKGFVIKKITDEIPVFSSLVKL